ncbi:MAG: efflux RND transporter periplasmic adaptor subunit [Planctomycetaceae bacterium]|nr:efflux RND transporter periplasmic adaptor subunit [Planctomycetaceae bacterium]
MNTSVDLKGLTIERSDSREPQVTPQRHLWSRYVFPLVLIVGFLSLISWATWDRMFPPREVTVMPVISSTATVQQEGTPLFSAAGWVEPRPTPIRVAALAPGVVEELLVVEDQPVKKQEVVAELIKDDAQLAYERALADQKLRSAELSEAESDLIAAITRFEQPVHLEAALGEADATLAKIQTELKNLPFQLQRATADETASRKDYEGKRDSKGVVSGVQIDIAKGKLDSAAALVAELKDRKASLQSEQKALTQRRDALKTQLKLLAEELKAKQSAEARLEAAKARLKQTEVMVAEAKLRLDRMTIKAPVDGRIYQLIAHPGARIGSGMTQMQGHDGSTIVTMYQPDKLQIRVDVRFSDIPQVRLKQKVEIDNPALKKPIEGEVLFISSKADIQKNTLEVKVGIPDAPPVFKPEMLVDVTFLAPEQKNKPTEPTESLKLYAPQQLVQSDDGGDFVWIADQSDGVARQARIETQSPARNGLVEVTSGLTVTSRLIVEGRESLEPEQRIRVMGEDLDFGPSGTQAEGE